MQKDGSEGTERNSQLRLQSWGQAIDRGIESGLLGLGPGPHIENPPILIAARLTEKEPINIEHPPLNSTPNFEAHNTLVDLFTQGGLLAVASIVWLAAITLWLTFKGGLHGLTTLICGLLIFSTTHLFVRHPIFCSRLPSVPVEGTGAERRRSRIGAESMWYRGIPWHLERRTRQPRNSETSGRGPASSYPDGVFGPIALGIAVATVGSPSSICPMRAGKPMLS
jgi:hypothetical protein